MIGEKQSIPALKAMIGSSRWATGYIGEVLIARALEANGYQVALNHRVGDLTAYAPSGEIFYAEVKTAKRNKDGSYHFTLWKHWQGRLCTDSRKADLVILLCVTKASETIPFVVPAENMGNRKAVAVYGYPTDYTGWLAPFRQNIRRLTLECVK